MSAPDRYMAGRTCGRGKHDYSQDMGNYLRCPRCGSTKTKPAGEMRDLSTADRRWPVLRAFRARTGQPGLQYAGLKRLGVDAENPRTQDAYNEDARALKWQTGRVNCPDCGGEGGRVYEGRWASCSMCGGDRYLTKGEFNWLARRRRGGSPAERLGAIG